MTQASAPAAPTTRSAMPAASTFDTSDGIRIAFYRWNDTAAGWPVVLHHGFAADASRNWLKPGIVDAFVSAGRSVIAVDARGHGASAKPHDPSYYGEARMARDLRELLDTLGVTGVDLFGYSMGAVVSLIVALEDSRVRRLVLGGIGEGAVLSGGVDMRLMHRDLVADALLAADPSTIAHPGGAMFRHFAQSTGGDLAALAGQARRMHDVPLDLGAITAPTLVIAGKDDVLAVFPERLAAAIPGAECVVVPGDHLSAVGQPELAAAAVAFLSR